MRLRIIFSLIIFPLCIQLYASNSLSEIGEESIEYEEEINEYEKNINQKIIDYTALKALKIKKIDNRKYLVMQEKSLVELHPNKGGGNDE